MMSASVRRSTQHANTNQGHMQDMHMQLLLASKEQYMRGQTIRLHSQH